MNPFASSAILEATGPAITFKQLRGNKRVSLLCPWALLELGCPWESANFSWEGSWQKRLSQDRQEVEAKPDTFSSSHLPMGSSLESSYWRQGSPNLELVHYIETTSDKRTVGVLCHLVISVVPLDQMV